MPINYLAFINPKACASLNVNRAILSNPGIKFLYERTNRIGVEGIISFEAPSKMAAELFIKTLGKNKTDILSQLLPLSDFSAEKENRHEP